MQLDCFKRRLAGNAAADQRSRYGSGAIGPLIINLLWNEPLRAATGGGAVAFFALNLLPPAAVLAWASLGGGPER